MIEGHPYEDDATRYVLGLLGAKERREFEARLTQSLELRALVRGLEAGTVALSMAVPHREPPEKVWAGIQNAIDLEVQRRPVMAASGHRWLWSGWAAAACVLVGWFIYAFWLSHSPPPRTQPTLADNDSTGMENQSASPAPLSTAKVLRQSANDSNLVSPPPVQRSVTQATETAAMRRRIAEMEAQLAQLSQTFTQRQVLPPDFNRLTFFQFPATPSDKTAGGKMATPPAELQRALLLALARELGWLPPPATRPETREQKADEGNPPAQNTQSSIEFVDLPPADSDASPRRMVYPVADDSVPTQSKTAGVNDDEIRAEGGSTAGAIPALVSDNKLIFAINSLAVPAGADFVTVWSSSGNNQALAIGSVTVGTGPTVVTVPFTASSGPRQFTITAGPGGANIIGQYPPPGNHGP